MKLLRIAALVALIGGLAAFAGVGRPEGARSQDSAFPRAITVSGVGTVATIPNRAGFSFGVTPQAKTATAALATNGDGLRKVIAALKGAGVAPKDIQTESIFLSPRYSDNGEE